VGVDDAEAGEGAIDGATRRVELVLVSAGIRAVAAARGVRVRRRTDRVTGGLGGFAYLVVENVESAAKDTPLDHVFAVQGLKQEVGPRGEITHLPSPSVFHTAFSSSVLPVIMTRVPPSPPFSVEVFSIRPNSTRFGGIR
jgi:hypothetical protein